LKRSITESDILKACIVLAVIGLELIHISQSFIQPDKVDIGSIDETWIGNSVSVKGTVSSVSSSNETIFLTVEDGSGAITVVDFDGGNYSEGYSVTVKGYVEVYQSELEIVADEIKLK
jgi:DNA/RNA endonuclease YhcR with UshA esterase domain